MSDNEIKGNTISSSHEMADEDEWGGFDDEDETHDDSNTHDDSREKVEDYEDCLKEKYKDVNYSKADKVNLIKKIEMYLYDPDLRKMVKEKIHLAPYIDLGSAKKKRDFNELDGATLNWIYDELRDSSMNSLISDATFNGYVGINNIIESIAVTSGYVPELEGYSDKLDTPLNRLLIKQITIDNFNYFSGSLSPQYLLMYNTLTCMTGTYKVNKAKAKAKAIKSQPCVGLKKEVKDSCETHNDSCETHNDSCEKKGRKNIFGNNNPLPGFQ